MPLVAVIPRPSAQVARRARRTSGDQEDSALLHVEAGTRCIGLDADAEAFMVGGCALPTALHAVERGEIAIGDTVLVLGSGPVGINAIILSLMRGALRVLCIGAPDQRLEAATQVGASAVLNFEEHDEAGRLEWVREQTHGQGAAVTI